MKIVQQQFNKLADELSDYTGSGYSYPKNTKKLPTTNQKTTHTLPIHYPNFTHTLPTNYPNTTLNNTNNYPHITHKLNHKLPLINQKITKYIVQTNGNNGVSICEQYALAGVPTRIVVAVCSRNYSHRKPSRACSHECCSSGKDKNLALTSYSVTELDIQEQNSKNTIISMGCFIVVDDRNSSMKSRLSVRTPGLIIRQNARREMFHTFTLWGIRNRTASTSEAVQSVQETIVRNVSKRAVANLLPVHTSYPPLGS